MPPLQGRTLSEVNERFPKGDNQGGTANLNFVPEPQKAASGLFYLFSFDFYLFYLKGSVL